MQTPDRLLDLSGRIAVVTGGSRGIGKAVAEKLGKHGANVVISSTERSKHEALEVVGRIESFGQRGLWVPGDIAKEGTGKQIIDAVVSQFGRLDILVHCAGITDDDLFMRLTGERWRRVIETNLSSGFYMAQPAARQMIRQKEGAMVFVSSVSAHGNPGQASYAASKAGLEGLMRTLAVECMSLKRPIRVNAVACGLVNTDMARKLTEEQRERIISISPLGRLIEPEEVASPILFLVSPMASAINGTILDIDGGILRR